MTEITRREFLQATGAGVAAAGVFAGLAGTALAADPAPMFPCSVASGDPSTSGVVLWTRVNPARWRAATPLRYEISIDPNFTRIVLSGDAPGHADAPSRDHTYHVRLNGVLSPGGVYFYRFIYGSVRSRTGRCRTLPTGRLDQLKLAVVTCNDFTNGYYGAFARIALDATVDFVAHLGDFIYETTGGTEFQNLSFPDRGIALPSGRNVAMGLGDYRMLYKTYRSDPLLQLAMEYHTWLIIWDDHEMANDCYWDFARDTAGAPDHPYQTEWRYRNRSAELLKKLKLESQRAWSEYVPSACVFDRSATHPHRALQINRSFRFGDLLDLFMTDERTYRSAHACGEQEFGGRYASRGCPQQESPQQTMLGAAQRDWLVAGIANSPCLWKGWGNQVLLGALTIGHNDPGGGDRLYFTTDGWDGFLAERRSILAAFRDAGVSNLVAMTGDLHTFIAAYLKVDYADPANDNPANVVGVEFMTPAVTSANLVQMFGAQPKARPSAGSIVPEFLFEGAVRTTNPHIQFFNSQDWGYSTVEFSRDWCEYTAIKVDKSINSPFAAATPIHKFRVPSGVPTMEQIPI